MPNRVMTAMQIGMLLLAVPLQYMISEYYSSTDTQRSFAIRRLVSNAVGFKDKYLSWDHWQTWCVHLYDNIKSGQFNFPENDEPEGESPAVEVMQYKDPKGYFSGSPTIRSPRPPHIKYRVGQVIRHKIWGYRGVIIGWDATARAPEDWFKNNHPNNKKHWRLQPNYSVIVDERDRMVPQATYIPEENIEVLTNVKVIHPSLDSFFEGFDGAQHLPRPHLRTLYPHD